MGGTYNRLIDTAKALIFGKGPDALNEPQIRLYTEWGERMMNESGHSRELSRLVDLCRELAKLGVHVGVSDARPALSVRGDLTDRKVWVEIDAGSFVWRRDDLARHPVDDAAGAAACLANYLKARGAESDRRS
ncbi:hypothetical protein [Actinoallomurus sp. NPDC052274]|uniref:hypothetical protein n=1 Tax=Actinoallomurus sp. NPDC052274 TaxID=3155420 RepID=UPI00341E698E